MSFHITEVPDNPTDDEEWEEVCKITSDISFYEDPSGRLFIDAVDVEEMAGEITIEKANKMATVLMRYLMNFEGAKIMTQEKNND